MRHFTKYPQSIQAAEDLIGKEVTILVGDLKGEWGIVKYFDGDYYHVSPWNGNEAMIFDRNEIRVNRKKPIKSAENIIRTPGLTGGMWVVDRGDDNAVPQQVKNVSYKAISGDAARYEVLFEGGDTVNYDASDEFIQVNPPKLTNYMIRYYDMYSGSETPTIGDIDAYSEEDAINKFCKENPNAVGVSVVH